MRELAEFVVADQQHRSDLTGREIELFGVATAGRGHQLFETGIGTMQIAQAVELGEGIEREG